MLERQDLALRAWIKAANSDIRLSDTERQKEIAEIVDGPAYTVSHVESQFNTSSKNKTRKREGEVCRETKRR